MRLRAHVLLTKIYVNATPQVSGCVTTGENGFDSFLRSDGRKLASALGSRGSCSMICAELLFGIW
jgi:hypothetical protein